MNRKSFILNATNKVCLPAAVLGLFMVMQAHAHDISAPETAGRTAKAVGAFLDSLSPAQLEAALFAFDDRQRFDWHYVPRRRAGLALADMSAAQRGLAFAILQAGLSEEGFRKAVNITRLESVLRVIETGNPMGRDPQRYFFSFFGRPSENANWGWRVEGHHLSLNFTIVDGHLFATAPRFLGANPAKVAHGKMAGLRALAGEEDLARKLVASLNENQLAKAVFSQRAYRDIVTGSAEEVSPLEPVGLPAGELDAGQKELLAGLIAEYIATLPPEIGRQRMQAIGSEAWDRIRFGWAGSLTPGKPHYYRIQGRSFLIEYDNVQNGANHIHTVWRDFDGDFGRDLLREHYRSAHR